MANNKLIEAIHEALVQLTPAERIEVVGEFIEVRDALKFHETAKESFQKCFNYAQALQAEYFNGKYPNIMQVSIETFKKVQPADKFLLVVSDYNGKTDSVIIIFGDTNNETKINRIKDFINSRIA